MFSCVSWHTRSMTSKASTPSASHSRAVSLAKVIFSAWKLLQQYFIISAERTEVWMNLHGRWPNSSRSSSTGVVVIGADDRERRLVVVADRRALAQELGLEAQVEVDAVALAAIALR